MTSTNDDTPPRQPDENKKKPLDHPDRDVLDFIDETVARITDAEVEEHLHFIDEIAGRPTAEIGKHFFCARPYIIRILLNSDSVTIHSAWEPVGTVMPRFTKQDRSQATPLNRIHGLHAAAALGEFAAHVQLTQHHDVKLTRDLDAELTQHHDAQLTDHDYDAELPRPLDAKLTHHHDAELADHDHDCGAG